MSTKTLVISTLIFIVILIAVGIAGIVKEYQQAPVVDQTPIATTTPQSVENDRIIAAVNTFASSAPAIFEDKFVCKGGFINEEIDEMKRISDTIVRNRIFDPETNQYAINQDEAGISCIESDDAWVLFTALNRTASGDNAGMYCVDSTGVRGAYGIDRDAASCVVDGV